MLAILSQTKPNAIPSLSNRFVITKKYNKIATVLHCDLKFSPTPFILVIPTQTPAKEPRGPVNLQVLLHLTLVD